MKKILEFQFPDDQHDFELCLNASKYHAALSSTQEWLRSMDKYSDKKKISVSDLREHFNEILMENEVPEI